MDKLSSITNTSIHTGVNGLVVGELRYFELTMVGLCPINNEGRINISPVIETSLNLGKKTIKRSSEVKLSRKDSELVLTKHQQSLNISHQKADRIAKTLSAHSTI